MNGEILYQYVGSPAKPLVETQINAYVLDAKDCIQTFTDETRKSQNGLAKRINKGRTNEEILLDLFTTGEELIHRIDATKIINKTSCKKQIIEVMGLIKAVL